MRWIDKDLSGRVDIEIVLDQHHGIARVNLHKQTSGNSKKTREVQFLQVC